MSRKPEVGESVWYFPPKEDEVARSNGNDSDPVAATITRVWSLTCVNLKIFPDHGPVQDRGSVAHRSQNPGTRAWCFIGEIIDFDFNKEATVQV